jgi:tRNA (guanine-N7-)-methyltransferase
VRSFALRAGRITVAQRRALAELWPRYGIELGEGPIDLDRVFGRRAPRILEIGFGDGELLAQMAQAQPEADFLGIEVHRPGIGHCLWLAERLGLGNLRLIAHDAVEVLRERLPDASLQRVNLFFPDPWPKKRHHKRRIVQPAFARLIAAKLAKGGLFHVVTDWAPYGAHIDAVMAGEPRFQRVPATAALRGRTKFERRGEELGHEIYERVWQRCAGSPG